MAIPPPLKGPWAWGDNDRTFYFALSGGGGHAPPKFHFPPQAGTQPSPPQVRTQGWGGYGRGGGHKGGGPGAGGRLGGTVGLGVPWVLWGWMM